jgi:hypothetical protein
MASPELVERWFALTRITLPDLADARGWPIGFDHCFQRVLLDNACARPWREAIAAPAYRHAPDEVMEKAIALGEAAAAGQADLPALNRASLRMRGKLPRTD